MIERYISQYLYLSLQTIASLPKAHLDTAARVIDCAQQPEWRDTDFELLAFLCTRVEISRCLYDSYLPGGGRASSNVLGTVPSTLTLLLLLKDMTRLLQSQRATEAAKRLNAVLKLRDSLGTALDTDLLDLVQDSLDGFFDSYSCPAPPAATVLAPPAKVATETTLAITVLFWEGPIARAYLAALKGIGLKPEKIIQLVSARDLSSKKPVGRFLPGLLRIAYAQSRQRNSIHHWSGVLQRSETALYRSVRSEIESSFDIPAEVIDDALALRDLSEYSANVEQLLVDDLNDERLYQRLTSLPESQVLFTGGGIVPRTLLELPHLKFIHVHPGFLPEVRGADCALWSQLVKGCTSATCFYMAPGIDDGDVIHPAWLPPLRFRIDTSSIPLKSLYRAIYAFFDPWVRATVLRQAISITSGFSAIKAQPQVEKNSITYHFMHERIQDATFKVLFENAC